MGRFLNINKFFLERNIRFKKENKVGVLFSLLNNRILLSIWKLKKRLKGIKTPVVHLYTVCWNEEKIIPFVLQYYNDIVEKVFVWDNYSDDHSEEILRKNNVKIKKYDTGGTFNDVVHQQIKNKVWKKSRGKADFVIVSDMDEILFHPQMQQFLKHALKKKYSILETHGYDMYALEYPVYNNMSLITDQIKTGIFSEKYSKSVIFDPHQIVNINYMPGAHECYPEGIVKVIKDENLKLLHYKNLGIKCLMDRVEQYRIRMSETNKKNGYCIEYDRENQQIINDFNAGMEKAITII